MAATASEVIGDPTDPSGTDRLNLPPEPTTGSCIKPLDCPYSDHPAQLPCDSKDALAIWELFFTPVQISSIVENCNQNRPPPEETRGPHARKWRDITVSELYTWLGILLYMGLHRENEIECYWSLDPMTPRHNLVIGAMGCNRWEDINRVFYLSAPVGPVEAVEPVGPAQHKQRGRPPKKKKQVDSVLSKFELSHQWIKDQTQKYWTPGRNPAAQPRSNNLRLRRIRKEGLRALWGFILNVILVNSYKLSSYEKKVQFRQQLIQRLVERGRSETPLKRTRSIQDQQHHKLGKRGPVQGCASCRELGQTSKPAKRRCLQEITPNSVRKPKVRQTTYGCLQCDVPLCKEGPCFSRFHDMIE